MYTVLVETGDVGTASRGGDQRIICTLWRWREELLVQLAEEET